MRCSMLLIIIAMGLLAADAFSPPRVRISPLPSKISIQQIHRSRQQRRQQHNNPLHRLYFREAVDDDNDTDEKVDIITSSKIDIVQTKQPSSSSSSSIKKSSTASRKTNGIYNRNDFPTDNTTSTNNNNTKRNKDKIKAKSASRLLKAKRLLGMLCRYYLQVFICFCCVVVVWLYIIFVGCVVVVWLYIIFVGICSKISTKHVQHSTQSLI